MKLIMDKSSICGAFLHLEDEEFGEDVLFEGDTYHIPSIETCMERFQYSLLNVLDGADLKTTDVISVNDPAGKVLSRLGINPEYKGTKRKSPPEFFKARKDFFTAADEWMKSRGVVIATPHKKLGVEADDLINQLAIRLPKTLIYTRDKDLLACPTNVLLVGRDGPELNPQKFPVKRENIHIYRAIVVGDKSDGLGTGVKGFGPKTWEKMLDQFGEGVIDDLQEIFEEENINLLDEAAKEFTPFQKLIDQEDHAYRVYQCMKFQPVPAHRVVWDSGLLHGESTLVTTDNFESVLIHLEAMDFDYSVIDYETSVGDESEEWLQSTGKDNIQRINVDVMESKIAGMGLRINGENFYFCVDHKDTDNVELSQLEQVLEILWGKIVYAHNSTGFENIITYNHFGTFLPHMHDTTIMACMLDENDYTHLKGLSKRYLGYQQATYKETLGDNTRMNQITGEEVVAYGIDDVICTDGLQNLFTIIMQYENTLEVFKDVEIDAGYFTSLCFINGMDFDHDEFKKLKRTNDLNIEESWEKLSGALLDLHWDGGEFRPIKGINMGELNRVHKAIHGTEIPGVTSAKMAILMMDDKKLAELADSRDFEEINNYYKNHWKPAAEFNVRSPKQTSKLLYEVLGCKVRITNKVTKNMRKKGVTKGSPATSEVAIRTAMANEDTPHIELLELLMEYKGYLTKESLFLSKWPNYVHWKTGKIHTSLKQSSTTTRRYSSSKPNAQQLPKRAGKEFRNMVKARKGYTLLALDFTGQELRLAADDSRDPAFVSCYLGEDQKDVHSLTGLAIAQKNGVEIGYEEFITLVNEGDPDRKEDRTLGKKVNFTAAYGCRAPKLAQTLLIKEGAAQKYLDSREMAFPVLAQRVKDFHKICRKQHYALTMLGARRHLGGHMHYGSRKDFDKQTADRLAYSMRIQGSAAEMTKLAAGKMYSSGLFDDGMVRPLVTIHDEVVLEIKTELMAERLPALVACMCQPYADMIIPMETKPEVGTHLGRLKAWKNE